MNTRHNNLSHRVGSIKHSSPLLSEDFLLTAILGGQGFDSVQGSYRFLQGELETLSTKSEID